MRRIPFGLALLIGGSLVMGTIPSVWAEDTPAQGESTTASSPRELKVSSSPSPVAVESEYTNASSAASTETDRKVVAVPVLPSPKVTSSVTTKEKVLARCDVVEKNIDTHLSTFEQEKELHIGRYHNILERIQKIITELKGKGYDTTQVTTDLATLTARVQAFQTADATYQAALAATKNYTCGASEGVFRASLTTARTNLVAVKQAAQGGARVLANHPPYRFAGLKEPKNHLPGADLVAGTFSE